jgi:hypothetical protein
MVGGTVVAGTMAVFGLRQAIQFIHVRLATGTMRPSIRTVCHPKRTLALSLTSAYAWPFFVYFLL